MPEDNKSAVCIQTNYVGDAKEDEILCKARDLFVKEITKRLKSNLRRKVAKPKPNIKITSLFDKEDDKLSQLKDNYR